LADSCASNRGKDAGGAQQPPSLAICHELQRFCDIERPLWELLQSNPEYDQVSTNQH
jgi:hypothetical protein